jgi:hypothetical protein
MNNGKNKKKRRIELGMVKCDECKYHEDTPVDEIYDPLTNEEWTIWGMYCNYYEREFECEYNPRDCPHYKPYKKED